MEAESGSEIKGLDFEVRKDAGADSGSALVSYNANLSPVARYAFVGHQWLLRGKTEEALTALRSALPLREAQIDVARIDAMAARYDDARDRLRALLKANDRDFEALSVMAYIEAKLQDYEVAATYYERALAVQESPALRQALANLPH